MGECSVGCCTRVASEEILHTQVCSKCAEDFNNYKLAKIKVEDMSDKKTVEDAVKEFNGVWPIETDGNNWWLEDDELKYSLSMTVNLVCTRKEFEDYAKMMELNKLNKEAASDLSEHSKEVSAIKTLESMGYNHNGGAMWRPPLSESKNKEAVKPVYTQEMPDNGELPPVGSLAVLRYNFDSKTVTHTGIVLFSSACNCILATEHGESHFKMGDYIYEPIDTRTDEEKLIDKVAEFIGLIAEDVNCSYESGAKTLIEKFDIKLK